MAGRQGRTAVARPSAPAASPLGLYLHIPFCQAICSYCNFNRGLVDDDLKRRYVDALAREIHTAAGADRREADTIFFGGGTPSLLTPGEVETLIAACRDTFALAPDAEVTLETNPESATVERLTAFRGAGVNRLSFGVQSFDDAELERLGRVHSAARAVQALGDARAAGFDNVSLDLMLWLPGQSRRSALRSVATAVALEPDHVSVYLLELYPNAPLQEAMARVAAPEGASDPVRREWAQTADDEAAEMYLEVFDTLADAGYAQYEISNAARGGAWSRHNLKYWQAGDWHGFGCGAHSTVAGRRWHNLASTAGYIDAVSAGRDPSIGCTEVAGEDRVAEALFTGLRLSGGVQRRNFQERFGVDPWSRHDVLFTTAAGEGLMWRDDEAFGLTPRGMLVANEILAEVI